MLIYSFFLGLLSLLSFVFLYLSVERILFFMTLRHLPKISADHIQNYMTSGNLPDECPRVKSSALMEVVQLMMQHQNSTEEQQKEARENWLLSHKAKLFYQLKWISFIGVAAFWVGFLGLVITGYDALLLITSAPHLWAPALYKSMSLCALGVMIFVPAILLSRALHIWGEFYIGRLKNALSLMMSAGLEYHAHKACPLSQVH